MKKFLAILLVSAVTAAGFALDGGGSITAGLQVQAPIKLPEAPKNLRNYEALNFYLQQNLDKIGNYNFYLDLGYTFFYSGNFYEDSKTQNTRNILDVNALKFSFLFPLQNYKSLFLQFGRFSDHDYTNIIYNQKLDGLSLDINTQIAKASFRLGYTGLLNTYTNRLYATPEKYSNKIYSFAPAFIVANANTSFMVGSYGHRLGLEFLSFTQTKKEHNYSIYTTAFVGGQIVPRLLFNLSGTMGVQSFGEGKPDISSLVVADIAYYFSQLSSALGFKILYASGADDKGKGAFSGFTMLPLSGISGMLPTDVIMLELYGSIKPVDNLLLKFTADTFLKGSKPAKDQSAFSGFQWRADVNYVLMNDLHMDFGLGQYVASKGTGSFLASVQFMLTF